MNTENDIKTILSQMEQPAFWVQDGIITEVNSNAANRFIEAGVAVDDLITQGKEEYLQTSNGCLYLTISLCGTDYPCVVTWLEGGNLFTVETDQLQPELRVLSLAAQQLSFPVTELTLLLDQLKDTPHSAKITHNLFRLKRIISNMSDASRYTTMASILNYCDVCSVFQEILEKAQTLLEESGIQLTYKLPKQPIYSQINQEMLQRAIYNLLSNAAKFSNQKKAVDVRLKQAGDKLYFTVTSQSDTSQTGANMFNRHLRQPGLEDRKFGLGLGMSLIHAAAKAHNGTVLIQQDKHHKICITMSLCITKSKESSVRSPVLLPDVYGGNDQALVELSDVLSSKLYQ